MWPHAGAATTLVLSETADCGMFFMAVTWQAMHVDCVTSLFARWQTLRSLQRPWHTHVMIMSKDIELQLPVQCTPYISKTLVAYLEAMRQIGAALYYKTGWASEPSLTLASNLPARRLTGFRTALTSRASLGLGIRDFLLPTACGADGPTPLPRRRAARSKPAEAGGGGGWVGGGGRGET